MTLSATLRELAAKATPGPWEELSAARSNLYHVETSSDHRGVFSVPKSRAADAALIVALVNHAPLLVAALRYAEASCSHPGDSASVGEFLAARNEFIAESARAARDGGR